MGTLRANRITVAFTFTFSALGRGALDHRGRRFLQFLKTKQFQIERRLDEKLKQFQIERWKMSTAIAHDDWSVWTIAGRLDSFILPLVYVSLA